MKLFRSIFLIMFCLLLAGCTKPASNKLPRGTWIDLTYDFSEDTIYWPTSEKFKLEHTHDGNTEEGYYYAANKFSTSEHGGTHVDAPVHFAESGKTIDEVPIDRFVGMIFVVDVSEKSLKSPEYQITVNDLKEWESKNHMLGNHSTVLFKTGYGKYWKDVEKYLGTSNRGEEALKELHFPGLHPEAALWLIDKKKVKAVGIDTASIDFGQSKDFKTHQILSHNDVLIYENVANLDKLPVRGAYVFALPMKIKNGSGAPVRIVALIPELD